MGRRSSSWQWNPTRPAHRHEVLRRHARQSPERYVSWFSPKVFGNGERGSFALVDARGHGHAFKVIGGDEQARRLLQLLFDCGGPSIVTDVVLRNCVAMPE